MIIIILILFESFSMALSDEFHIKMHKREELLQRSVTGPAADNVTCDALTLFGGDNNLPTV